MNVIYSDKYLEYGFGEDHPFRPERAEKFLELIKSKAGFKYEIVKAPRAADRDILLAHSNTYLERVKEAAKKGSRLSMDTPVSHKNLEAAYYYTGGTIKAAAFAYSMITRLRSENCKKSIK